VRRQHWWWTGDDPGDIESAWFSMPACAPKERGALQGPDAERKRLRRRSNVATARCRECRRITTQNLKKVQAPMTLSDEREQLPAGRRIQRFAVSS